MTIPTTAALSYRFRTVRAAIATLMALFAAAGLTLAAPPATSQPLLDPSSTSTLEAPYTIADPEEALVVPDLRDDHGPALGYNGNPWRQTAAKTWAFTQCIFGVGVPIGIAISLAATPQFWGFVAGYSPLPTWTHGAMKYGNTVKQRCRWAIFG